MEKPSEEAPKKRHASTIGRRPKYETTEQERTYLEIADLGKSTLCAKARAAGINKGGLTEIMRSILATHHVINEQTGETLTAAEAIAMAQIKKAIAGDQRAAEFIYERIDGRVLQETRDIGDGKKEVHYHVSDALIETLQLGAAEKARLRAMAALEDQRKMGKNNESYIHDAHYSEENAATPEPTPNT